MAIYIDDLGSDSSIDQSAIQAYVDSQVQGIINGAPAVLDTLKELADALGGDPAYAAHVVAQLAAKLNISGGTMTGPIVLPGAPTQPLQAATKSYVDTSIANIPAPLTSLSNLTDVNVSNVTNGQLLSWNGSRWVPSNPSSNYSLPTASTTTLGGVKVDGTTISVNNGIISAVGGVGTQGPAGARGVSVASAIIDVNGHLKVTLDDGTILDAGVTVGPQGATGAKGDIGAQGIQGPAGRSIAAGGAVIDGNGNLQITLTDGNVLNAGHVVGAQGAQGPQGVAGPQGAQGPAGATGAKGDTGLQGPQGVAGPKGDTGSAGLSITSGTVNGSGRLILTKSDASTIDVGSVVGPQGATGPAGPTGATGATGATGTSYTVNNKSGSVNIYGLSNTTQPGYDLEVDLSNKANKLTTARNISLTGKVTGLTSFDGSGNVTMLTSLNGVTTSDVAEGTNKYYTDARARAALSASTGLSYNSTTGSFALNANSDQITEGTNNLYFNNNRFDNRLGQSTLAQFSDVANVTPTVGQALVWNGNTWTPGTISGGSGGTSTGVYKATVQVDYDASGNLSSVTILNGGITAAIATATSTVATVTFTFTGSTCAPLGIQVAGYQRSTNVYVTRALASDFPTRTIIGGGSSGSPTAFSGFDASTNTMTLGLTKAATGASAGVGQTTHCVIQFLLST